MRLLLLKTCSRRPQPKLKLVALRNAGLSLLPSLNQSVRQAQIQLFDLQIGAKQLLCQLAEPFLWTDVLGKRVGVRNTDATSGILARVNTTDALRRAMSLGNAFKASRKLTLHLVNLRGKAVQTSRILTASRILTEVKKSTLAACRQEWRVTDASALPPDVRRGLCPALRLGCKALGCALGFGLCPQSMGQSRTGGIART